jgi:hypothetical protein
MLGIVLILCRVDQSRAGYEHLVQVDTSSSKIGQCPPSMVSSPEEIAHYCHTVRGQRFEMDKFQYRCFGGENSLCTGEINPYKKLPTCSQPNIASCEDETIYTNFNHHSKGPCFYRENDLAWHSAICGDGKFACWDPSLNEWCQGSVDDSVVSVDNISCPPTTVYSQYEATHYCSQSGLTTQIDPTDATKYTCYQKDGSAVCAGRIDGRRPPSCSARIHSCETIDKVCEPGRKTFCDEEISAFECWDQDLERWCLGQIVKPYTRIHAKPPLEGSQTPPLAAAAASTNEASQFSPTSTHHTLPGLLVLVSLSIVGTLCVRAFRLRTIPDKGKTILLPTQLGYYHPISDGMELTLLVA